jgi:hypothetical protein
MADRRAIDHALPVVSTHRRQGAAAMLAVQPDAEPDGHRVAERHERDVERAHRGTASSAS